MKIALVYCPYFPSQFSVDIGFAYCISTIKKLNHEVAVFDLNTEFQLRLDESEKKELRSNISNADFFRQFGKSIANKYNQSIDNIANRILQFKPEIIGFSVWMLNREFTMELAKKIKEIDSSIFIIFGGPECYPLWSGNTLANTKIADICVYGEAEITIKKVLDSISKYGKILPIPGTILSDNGKLIDSGMPEIVNNLDELPFPALDEFEDTIFRSQSLPISFSRSCLYKCEYCTTDMFTRYRYREPKQIVKEIEHWVLRYPDVKKFYVCDPAVTCNPRQIESICDHIISKGLEVLFSGMAVTHPGLNFNLLTKMKQAGFEGFSYGVETGSERMLKIIGKKINLEIVERVIKDTYRSGIYAGVNIIIGLPGETETDFDQTIQFLLRNIKYIYRISISKFFIMPYSSISLHKERYELVPDEIKYQRLEKFKNVFTSLDNSVDIEYVGMSSDANNN